MKTEELVWFLNFAWDAQLHAGSVGLKKNRKLDASLLTALRDRTQWDVPETRALFEASAQKVCNANGKELLGILEAINGGTKEKNVRRFLRDFFGLLSRERRGAIEAQLLKHAKDGAFDDLYGGFYVILPIILQHATKRTRDARLKDWEEKLIPADNLAAMAFRKYWVQRLRWYVKKKDWIRVWNDLKKALAWASGHEPIEKEFVDIVHFAMVDAGVAWLETKDTPPWQGTEARKLALMPIDCQQKVRTIRATSLRLKALRKQPKN